MDGMQQFFAMGGHAVYIWPAFAIVLLVMALIWISSMRAWRRSEETLAALRQHRRQSEGADK